MTEDNESKLDIDWMKTIAGALAAVSSAVLLSTLGAAGTLIGAALGSVIATVGGAVYTQGLATSKQQLARAQETARLKVGLAQAEVRRANRRQGDDTAVEAHLVHAEEQLHDAQDDLESLDDSIEKPGWRERLVVLPWKRVALVAAGLFAAAVIIITAFELVAGESVSKLTGGTDGDGGTTISRIGGGSDDTKDEPTEQDGEPVDERPGEPTADADPDEEPSAEPSEDPSEEPSLEPAPSATLPEPSAEPSEPPAAE